jgi:hypothetical protein
MSSSSEVQTADAQEKGLNAFEFLAKFEGAPTEEQIEAWKSAAPGGRVRLFTPDMKRVFVLRAIGALELEKIEQQLANVPQEKIARELQKAVCSQATLWTNITKTGKLTNQELQAGPAGLPATMHDVVSELSDFLHPQIVEKLTIDF